MTMFHLLACDGCWSGGLAVLGLVIAVSVLIGSIYILLWSNLGARQAYLVLMVSLSAWMMILSSLWLFGAPGTTPGTGPRAREAAWVPFTPDSQVAREDFAAAVASFPNGNWKTVKELPSGYVFPGNINATGEEINVFGKVEAAEAALAKKQGLDAVHPAYPGDSENDWIFRDGAVPSAIPGDQTPVAVVKFQQVGNHLLFGAVIPAVTKAKAAKLAKAVPPVTVLPHPQTIAFAYRDKGIVFLYALEFLVVFLLLFIVHLVLLARYETSQRKRAQEQEAQAPEPVLV
jgi:hypothetical protein